MIREIEKKLHEIKKKMPFEDKIRGKLSFEEKKYWVWENMCLEGHQVSMEQIEKSLRGEETFYGSIDEGLMIWKVDQLREKIYAFDRENYDFDLKMLMKLKLLLGDNTKGFRKSTTPAMYLSYMPPPPQEVPKMMADYVPFFHRKDKDEDIFYQSAKIHNRFIEIFPFKSGNLVLARTLMQYYIIRSGYPMVPMGLSQENYFNAIKAFLHKGDCSSLAEILRHKMKKRLEIIEKANN